MATGVKNGKPASRRTKGAKAPLWRRAFKWTLIAGAVVTVLGAVVGYLIYRNVDIPDANAEFLTQTTTVFYSDGKTPIGKFEVQNRQNVELDQVSPSMQQAIIAAEDRSFYTNRGIDIRGIVRAARNNATSNSTQGASTITQQYVKVLYLTQEQTLKRKAREAILSVKIHNQLSKDDILEGYLNTVYFGNGAYGVQAASEKYFDKDAADLSVDESAMLASVVNSPSGMDPFGSDTTRERLLERYQYVLDGMVKAEEITQAEADEVGDRLPAFADQAQRSRFGGTKGYLLRLTDLQLQKQGFTDAQINGGGLNVRTTFNRKAQNATVEAIKETAPDGLGQLHVASTSVDVKTGAVRAMYGGPDYLDSQLNWATSGAQPGSTFKPFAVAAALRNGYSLNTSLDGNSPIRVGNDTVGNQGDSGGESFGRVSLRRATQKSINTAFVDLTEQMDNGPTEIRKAARDAGIPQNVIKRIPSVPVTSLGVEPVPVIDMANAYSTFANEGQRHEWFVVSKVSDAKGDVLFDHEVKTERGFSADVAADVTSALQGVTQADGTGLNGRTICPTAGKTGTATFQSGPGEPQRVSSSWFVGYTPKMATAVMYVRGKNGNADLEGYLQPFFGGQYPARTFANIMDGEIDGDSCGTFPPAANIRATEGTSYVPPATRYTPRQTERNRDDGDDEETTRPRDEETEDPNGNGDGEGNAGGGGGGNGGDGNGTGEGNGEGGGAGNGNGTGEGGGAGNGTGEGNGNGTGEGNDPPAPPAPAAP
ncbi:MAG: transglycosylase domain-containing protein [Nocardioidaceae bacterium]|nr:transglycosylase domain-containing protein [Nocardioidaceae bacterium]